MAEKKYVGGGKPSGKYDNINIGIRFADLPAPNERGYINLVVGLRKEPSKSGETHSVWVNDYVPGAGRGEERQEQARQGFQPGDPLPEEPSGKIDDLPF